MSTAETIALALLSLALKTSPKIVELVTGTDAKTLGERLDRAHASVKPPTDVGPSDAIGDAELERIIRGEG